MKTYVTLALLSGSVLAGCAVSPVYDTPVVVRPPVVYGPPPPVVYAPPPVYVAPAPVVVRPAVSLGFSYYRGWGGYGHHHHF